MSVKRTAELSVVVPAYNEAKGLLAFHDSLVKSVRSEVQSYEIIYCDDGSSDNTLEIVQKLRQSDPRVKLIRLSRNFGKENALTAGIAAASGKAILTIDGDGQHPVELIPQFVKAWREGDQVIIGVRQNNKGQDIVRRLGSRIFYSIFNKLTGQKLVPGSTDFRLIDRAVQQAFLGLKETDRITRGLIDWLGFRRKLIYFKANARQSGSPGYSIGKLMGLAANSFVSLSPTPLYLFGYVGVLISVVAFLLGLSVLIEQIMLGDPLGWQFTGTAMLGILLLFSVGVVLMSQGILSLYISHIHNQSKARPLYVIDYGESAGIEKPDA